MVVYEKLLNSNPDYSPCPLRRAVGCHETACSTAAAAGGGGEGGALGLGPLSYTPQCTSIKGLVVSIRWYLGFFKRQLGVLVSGTLLSNRI